MGAVRRAGDTTAMYCGFGRQAGKDGTETMHEHVQVVRTVRASLARWQGDGRRRLERILRTRAALPPECQMASIRCSHR